MATYDQQAHIRKLYQQDRVAVAVTLNAALSSSYVVLPLGENAGFQGSEGPGAPGFVGLMDMRIKLEGITSATTLTAYFCQDGNGDHAITDASAKAIVLGAATTTDGGVGYTVSAKPRGLNALYPEGAIYVAMKLDSGTATAAEVMTFFNPLNSVESN